MSAKRSVMSTSKKNIKNNKAAKKGVEEITMNNNKNKNKNKGEGREDENPYFFSESSSFKTKVKTSEGSFRILQRFSKRSKLLRGIENYRIAILEMNPNTFAIPNHWDGNVVLYVAKGICVTLF
ncbi:hypothetical protein GIB67_033556 [Kingdonia uniflora]|uniref:Uncharacterized protein n=1 Tax=Kingdonia uniflora TaxID=39325 RepID=A0A7J7L6C3_9MAGN|nr:hypothetical protein GIB67_033556 [Kingdonia uniflora]